jgi:hypothetical protein
VSCCPALEPRPLLGWWGWGCARTVGPYSFGRLHVRRSKPTSTARLNLHNWCLILFCLHRTGHRSRIVSIEVELLNLRKEFALHRLITCVLGKRPKLPNCGNGLRAQGDMGSGSREKAEIEKDAAVFHLEPRRGTPLVTVLRLGMHKHANFTHPPQEKLSFCWIPVRRSVRRGAHRRPRR